MKILLTSTVFYKQEGIYRYVVELAERFVKEHEVHLLTSKYESKVEGLVVHENPIIWSPISLQVASNALLNISRINKLRRDGIEVVNSQGAEAVNADIVTSQSCHKAAVRIFMRDRGSAYAMLKPFEPRTNFVLAIEKHIYKHSKKVIAISKSVKEEIMGNYGTPADKIEVIYSGVNLTEFNPKNRGEYSSVIRKKYGLDEGDIILIFSGKEFKRKGLQYVIEALPSLNSNVKLLVVGGADKEPYETLANRLGVKNRVVFAGHQKSISEYYAASDLFVFPTAYEPFGLVITEAMASGLPVVTTKTAGAAELITDGVDGMLLESPYDSSEVAEKIKYVIDNNLSGKIGSQARKTDEKYSWDKMAGETLKVYESVLKK
ncbi:MAG: glycosyltransferase family 4 protein [Candidatus Altiarchaeota archaeon]|nr:glycosyltransferase family 4 protein [Candidatus Altiarchaeota archaeon]